ncbi:early activation antigen CD69-like [Poecilia formosa]|nr:PREDICTED: early activation antigen CD69-like [Poecilia formosa]
MYENIEFIPTSGSEFFPDSGEETVQTPDSSTHLGVGLSLQNEGVETEKPPLAVQGKPYSTVFLMFGLLILLVVVDIGVRVKIYHLVVEKPLQTRFENHTKEQTEWQELRESYFYCASTEKKNWTESRKDCMSRGGDLVILNNKEKQGMIERMKIHGDSWIGLQSSDEWTAKWKWVDGTDLAYGSWRDGVNVKTEPESKAFTDQQGLWMLDKTGLKYWICEKKNVQHLGDLKPEKNISKT